MNAGVAFRMFTFWLSNRIASAEGRSISTMVDAVVLSPVLFLFSLILAKLSTSMGRRDKGGLF